MRTLTRHIIPAAFILLFISGCEFEKKFLTVEQIGKATIETFFSELDGLKAAGEGLHKELRSFVDKDLLRYGDVRGDLLATTVNTGEGELLAYNYELTAEHVSTYPRNLWADGWSVVSSANYILHYGQKLMDGNRFTLPSEKATMETIFAQARFARAFAHFYLVNCYAWPYNYKADHSQIGIPIMDHVPGFNDKVARRSVADVYAFIFSDLEEARKLFASAAERDPASAQTNCQINSISDCYKISDIACEALLARINLYIGEWEAAEKHAKAVMDKVPLTPHDRYVDMFRKSQDYHGTEAILRMNSLNNTTSTASFYDDSRSLGADFVPDAGFKALFAPYDIRASLLTYVPLPTEECASRGPFNCVCKYLYDRTITDPYKQVHDCFVLRCSEMYLIHAEAAVRGRGDVNTAIDDIKALLARAYNVPVSSVDVQAGSADVVLNLIEMERTKELCFEGHRFFDMMRLGKDLNRPSSSTAKLKYLKYPDYRFVLPIDRMECQYNEAMEQNEGYDDYKTGGPKNGTDSEAENDN